MVALREAPVERKEKTGRERSGSKGGILQCVYFSSGCPLWLRERRPDWLYRRHGRPQNDNPDPTSINASETTGNSYSAQVMRLDQLYMHGFAWRGTMQLVIERCKAAAIGTTARRPQLRQSRRVASNSLVLRAAAERSPCRSSSVSQIPRAEGPRWP
jgi:hypothetical protein